MEDDRQNQKQTMLPKTNKNGLYAVLKYITVTTGNLTNTATNIKDKKNKKLYWL